MNLRLLLAVGLLSTLLGRPAFAQEGVSEECLNLGLYTIEECEAYYSGGQPAAEEPVAEEPVYEEPPVEEPVYEEPAVEEPVYEEPAIEEPIYDEPVPEEPVYDEPPVEDEQPVYDDQPEEPVADEPANEQPMFSDETPADDLVEPDATQDDVTPTDDATDEALPADEQTVEDDASGGDEIVPDDAGSDEQATEAEDASSEDLATLPDVTEETVDEAVDEGLVSADAEVTPEDEAFTEVLSVDDDPLANMPSEELASATEPLDGVADGEANALFDSAKGDDYTAPEGEPEDIEVPETDADAQIMSELSSDAIVARSDEPGERLDSAPQYNTYNNTTIINTTENTYIYQENNTYYINNTYEDRDRVFNGNDNYYYDQIGDNQFRETVYRDDGSQVVTIRDQYGNILERFVVRPDGSSYVLAYFEPDYYDDLTYWGDPGYGLPALYLNIPLRDYVLDWRYADAYSIAVFFRNPPVEPARRVYSIDEVKRSARLRDSVRRLEVNNLNFALGSAELSRTQANGLERLATAIQDLLDDNPAETFLIEGHTDAVGNPQENLRLSDKRASNVARILTRFYGIPPENLVTQGYGEQFLRVNTPRAEPQNRRVTVRRITPLITPRFAG